MAVRMEPVSAAAAGMNATRQPSAGEEVVDILANDLRLVCTPRKVAPGRLSYLLHLAFQAVRASRAGIAVLAGGFMAFFGTAAAAIAGHRADRPA